MKPSNKEKSKIRLQVFLSHSGVCSRRKALEIIQAGHVSVNKKKILEPSTQVDPGKDKVCVNGKAVQGKDYEYIVLNKPTGFTVTKADKFAEKTVFDILPKQFKHLSPVGRLDKDTEGLLLMTNDGDLAYKLTHPKFNVDKTYFVRIGGKLSGEKQKRLEKGVYLDGKKTAPAEIKNVKVLQDQTEFLMIIHEGRKRQIRLMVRSIGHSVSYLKRLSQGPLQLGNLKTGQWKILKKRDLGLL